MNPKHLVFTFLSLMLFSGCEKDGIKVPEGNLIFNSSFEFNNIPAFDGWTGSGYSFIEDAPDDGGRWALQLEPGWFPGEGYAETYFMGYEGEYSFDFTCEAKSLEGWVVEVSIVVQEENGMPQILKKTNFNFSDWSGINLTLSVLLKKTDKLIIHLSAGSTEIATGKVLFDKISLERK
jgi:hypothetical protein